KANASCTYKYSVDAKIKGGEEIDVTANVDIFCESVGIFKKEPAIRHCINVRDAVGRISNKGNKYDSDTEAPVKGLDKWFCFAQSSKTGKILGVFYPKKEKEWIVNIKKSIASTFQANYKGTTVATETDSQSKHKSHY
uniref:Vitellogenin domain-containing protein n=1 Tax=Amphimedon queenslandica TaxID=400682 RepID=A0A1X7UPJ7_AMPQE